MRQEVIDYIQTLTLGSFIASTDVPWDENGTPMYVKNLKKIYVSNTEYENTPIVQTLGGININNELMTTTIYFANDAKTLPANYADVVTDLKTTKDIDTIEGIHTREVNVGVSYEGDVMITEIEIRFGKLST